MTPEVLFTRHTLPSMPEGVIRHDLASNLTLQVKLTDGDEFHRPGLRSIGRPLKRRVWFLSPRDLQIKLSFKPSAQQDLFPTVERPRRVGPLGVSASVARAFVSSVFPETSCEANGVRAWCAR